jgi:hypothetical protein
METVGYIIAASVDDGRMDCEDDDRIHVWLVVPAWGVRRAMQVQGSPFVRTWLAHRKLPSLYISAVLGGSSSSAELREYSDQVLGKHFRFTIVLPPYEEEAGERVEITDIRVATMSREFAIKMGIDPDTVELED